MKNEKVKHNKFGDGKIIEVENMHIKVWFDSCQDLKTFLYPDAFEFYLEFYNVEMQNEAMRLISQIKKIKAEEEEKKNLEYIKIEEERQKEKSEVLKRRKKAAKAKADKEERDRLKKEEKENNVVNI